MVNSKKFKILSDADKEILIIALSYGLSIGFLLLTLNTGKNRDYTCKKCFKVFKPSWINYLVSPHYGGHRFMRCNHCGRYSWCKSV